MDKSLLVHEVKKDIISIVDDCLSTDENIDLSELVLLVYEILPDFYDKKKVKNFHKNIIKQFIAQLYPDLYGDCYNFFEYIDNTDVVEHVKTLPQPEQRTPEWYQIRRESIGASESASIWGDNPYASSNKLLLKKCGYDPHGFKPGPHCLWGIKYEPIIQQLYELKHNTTLIEFGSIKHQEIDHISASPDGITPDGIMCEIKAPLTRVITGIPTIYYWYQMQQQLQVCKLDKVDFVEVKLSEYLNYDQYKDDEHIDHKNECFTKDNTYKNVIIEYWDDNNEDLDSKMPNYVYPVNFLNTDEIPDYIKLQKKEIDNSSNKIYSRAIYWKVEVYSECEVWKDTEWWRNHKDDYKQFWDKVLYHRKHGYDDLIRKKGVKKFSCKKKPSNNDCLIESDSDSEN